ncbi:MAG: type I methionyl aminopeptidase [Minisyncoccia bacterium]
MIRLKSDDDIKYLEISGQILSKILKSLAQYVDSGVKLKDLDLLARDLLKKYNAQSAFLNYKPSGAQKAYPAVLCTSVNNQVVHGLPDKYILQSGDILKIDFSVNYQGYITDAALTIGIGKISDDAKHLINFTKKALAEGIKQCQPGNHIGDIGWVIESVIKKANLKVLKSLTGHGVGFELHEDPYVYNYGEKGSGQELVPGMVLAIEPLVSISTENIIQANDDSYWTDDGSLSAHFEKTVAITKDGYKILTPY